MSLIDTKRKKIGVLKWWQFEEVVVQLFALMFHYGLDLPHDAELVGIEVQGEGKDTRVAIKVAHWSFAETPEGARYPELPLRSYPQEPSP